MQTFIGSFFIARRLRFSRNHKPSRTVIAVLQQTVIAGFYYKSALTQQSANHSRIIHRFPDVLLKLKLLVFKDTDFQIDLICFWPSHLEPDPYRFIEIHLKRFTGRYFPIVQNVKNKVATRAGIVIHIPENLSDIRKSPDMVQRISGAGHQIKLRIRTICNHIRHIILNLGVPLPGNLDHTGRKVHAGSPDTAVLQNLAQNTGTTA